MISSDQMQRAEVVRWAESAPPTEEDLRSMMPIERLDPNAWGNGPNTRYAAHTHSYHKVLYVVRRSIRFELHPDNPLDLYPGDRLDLPPGIEHSAIVGPDGVLCLEARKG